MESLIRDFHDAVDEYLVFCAENRKEPQQQYKGSFNVRISPELCRQASLMAQSRHISLNSFIEQSVKNYVAHGAE